MRATYEGVAFAMLDCYQHMPGEIKRLTVCGGGANSAVWCQMFADAVATRIVTVKGDELGAKGVVLNDAVVQGICGRLQGGGRGDGRVGPRVRAGYEGA